MENPSNMENLSEILSRDGVVVIDILTRKGAIERQNKINEQILNGPELIRPLPENTHISNLVGGGFGAFGSPSASHVPEIRQLRYTIHKKLIANGFYENFSNFCNVLNVEVLADRYRAQQKGTKYGGEGYHRDESNNASEGDVILGGWINLSSSISQYFSCLKTTQLRTNEKRGFSQQKPTEEQLKHSAKVEVKPGQLILFYQNILHQVNPAKLKEDSYRLHFGLRFTNSDESLFPLDNIFSNFDPFQLPSGQDARMWPKLWWVNFPAKLEALSKYYKPELRVERSLKKDPTIKREIVPEVLKLTPAMRKHFLKYSEKEKALYRPQPTKRTREEPENCNATLVTKKNKIKPVFNF